MAPARPRKVGILGGMGPEATVLLMSRIIARTPAQDDDDHIPMIVDNNTQVPSRIRALIEGTGEDPTPVLAGMAKGLKQAGAEVLAMACNTAHNYAPAIRAATDLPLLDMVALTAGHVVAKVPGVKKVGILASPAVRITGLFDRAFGALGVETLYPDDESRILAAIRAIKKSSAAPEARTILREAARELTAKGAQCLIVGCSEFSVIADAIAADYPVVDSLDVLADAVVAFAKPAA